MNMTMETLWNEFLAGECAAARTDEERTLMRRVAEAHAELKARLTPEQSAADEAYTEAVYELQSCLMKKAFFCGCELASSFILTVSAAKKAPLA